jgi:hypothetical protein
MFGVAGLALWIVDGRILVPVTSVSDHGELILRGVSRSTELLMFILADRNEELLPCRQQGWELHLILLN